MQGYVTFRTMLSYLRESFSFAWQFTKPSLYYKLDDDHDDNTEPGPHIYWMTIITMIMTMPLLPSLLVMMMTMITTIPYSKYLNRPFHYGVMIWLE